jgi:hypothetical protein
MDFARALFYFVPSMCAICGGYKLRYLVLEDNIFMRRLTLP